MLKDTHWSLLWRVAVFWFPTMWYQQQLIDELFNEWEREYGTPVEPHCIIKRNEAVRAKISKERLLEFDVKQGWEPICEVGPAISQGHQLLVVYVCSENILRPARQFLGKPIPGEPFPHLNDGPGLKRAFFVFKMTVIVPSVVLRKLS